METPHSIGTPKGWLEAANVPRLGTNRRPPSSYFCILRERNNASRVAKNRARSIVRFLFSLAWFPAAQFVLLFFANYRRHLPGRSPPSPDNPFNGSSGEELIKRRG